MVLEIPRQMRQLQGNVAGVGAGWTAGGGRRRTRRARPERTQERPLQLPAHLGDDAGLPEVGRHFAQEFHWKGREEGEEG